MSQELDALQSALLGPSFDVNSDEAIVTKAEDLQTGGIDYTKTYFEPKIGESYLIKFLPNPGGDLVTHRSVYKKLPDPERRGKTFHYISSGNAKTCKALDLFFELNAKKKEGDMVAQKKIEKYLSRTNQACVKVQILSSPNREDIGKIRLFVFSTFGPNAHIANLIDQKLNPTKEQKEQGFEREDIFNIFDSSVLNINCKKAVYDGVEGRDFSGSQWAPKHKGAIAIDENGKTRQFEAKDIVNGKLTDEAKPWFQVFLKQFNNPDVDVLKFFAYKTGEEPQLDEETRKYVKDTFRKVDEIIPIIRDCSIAEIEKYGKKSESSDDKKSDKKQKNVLEESVPDELQNSAMTQESPKPAQKAQVDDDDVDSILNEE